MKKYLIVLISLFSFALAKDSGYSFEVREDRYDLASYFRIDSDNTYRGNVKKSKIRLRTNYDLSDVNGWQATGIVRSFSLGAFWPSMKTIDIYDTNWDFIGMVSGSIWTSGKARYDFYDKDENLTAIAYLDKNAGSFDVVLPDQELYQIARLKRNFILDDVDTWNVKVFESDKIDERIMRIFAAFAADYQSYFKKDL